MLRTDPRKTTSADAIFSQAGADAFMLHEHASAVAFDKANQVSARRTDTDLLTTVANGLFPIGRPSKVSYRSRNSCLLPRELFNDYVVVLVEHADGQQFARFGR